MSISMFVDAPPAGTVLERTERRIVQLTKTATGIAINVWLRQVITVNPTKLGGWYCSPDAGVNLTNDAARILRDALGGL